MNRWCARGQTLFVVYTMTTVVGAFSSGGTRLAKGSATVNFMRNLQLLTLLPALITMDLIIVLLCLDGDVRLGRNVG